MMIYRLQGCKKSAVIGWMASMLLVAGCTQDKLADASQGGMLPEGKYPITFTATGLEIPAATRATADGTWTQGNEIAVKVEGVAEAKHYTAVNSGESTMLEPAYNVIPFYWQSTSDINVSAWYVGTGYSFVLPETWPVQSDQNFNEFISSGYQESDFLYAPQTAIDFKGTKSLTFYHQTAKVVINIRKEGVATDASKITSVKINSISVGNFNQNASGNYSLSASEGPYIAITPQKTTANTGVVFEANKAGETALASYRALVIPQEVNKTSIEINIEGYAPFKYTPTVPDTSGKWAGGTQYTYNLTIKGSVVTATVTNSISWGDKEGGTGGGTVEI